MRTIVDVRSPPPTARERAEKVRIPLCSARTHKIRFRIHTRINAAYVFVTVVLGRTCKFYPPLTYRRCLLYVLCHVAALLRSIIILYRIYRSDKRSGWPGLGNRGADNACTRALEPCYIYTRFYNALLRSPMRSTAHILFSCTM